MIRKLFLAVLAQAVLFPAFSQALRTPQPSPTQTVKQDFGIGSVELSYSRPGMKGRKIFGDLVPFGAVWRAGANNATTLTFSDEVVIGGKKVAPGKYGLVAIPERNEWTFILTKQTDITSPAAYKQENDVVRVKAKTQTLSEPVETFTMQFVNVKPTSLDLAVMWEKTSVRLPVQTDVDTRIMQQIQASMGGQNPPYFQAALYYLENGKDLNQALTWFDKAIEQNKEAFWIFHQKANALAKLGKKEEAKAAARQSITLAKAQKNEDYVRLNEKLIATL